MFAHLCVCKEGQHYLNIPCLYSYIKWFAENEVTLDKHEKGLFVFSVSPIFVSLWGNLVKMNCTISCFLQNTKQLISSGPLEREVWSQVCPSPRCCSLFYYRVIKYERLITALNDRWLVWTQGHSKGQVLRRRHLQPKESLSFVCSQV